MNILLIAILAYLVLQFGIGIWASRRIRTEDDYLIAGRRLGTPLTLFSIFATWYGAETIVGSAGQAYSNGISLTSAEPFAYGLCLILMGIIFAVPLWKRDLTTLADLYRKRYSASVERLAAIILIPSSILWAAAQVRAFGYVLSTASTLTTETAIAVAAVFVILYTMFGGLLADAVTDMIQGGVLIVGLVIIAAVVVVQLGGASFEYAFAPGRLRLASTDGVTLLGMIEEWAIPVCGSVVAAEIVQRVIAARSPEIARRGSVGAGALYLAAGLIPVFIGLAATGLELSVDDPEQIIPLVAQTMLPTVMHAIFVGALVSAILSTVDSTLLVAAGLLSHNLLLPALGIEQERTRVFAARASVIGFGLIAWFLARGATGVFALVEQASAFGSAGALVTISFGLFTSWGGPKSAALSLLLGVATYVAGIVLGWPYPYLASLAAALGGYVVVAGSPGGSVSRHSSVAS